MIAMQEMDYPVGSGVLIVQDPKTEMLQTTLKEPPNPDNLNLICYDLYYAPSCTNFGVSSCVKEVGNLTLSYTFQYFKYLKQHHLCRLYLAGSLSFSNSLKF